MTSLSRVTDQTKEEMQSFFNESIELADQLSVKITDLNEAIIGFSRMGYRGQDLLNMAESATIMAGVSDLTLDESMSRIVSAMQIFGIEAEDATDKIVSFMNEIDNNFAITTADLSDGLSRAGATANSFGVDMATALGHITAIGEASRESGRIVGNSLKTIYSRITTMSASENILNSVGVSIRSMNGEIRDVSEILEELAGKWSTLSAEQQQNLGVTLAGRYQLSRFLLLMQNFHRSQEATAAALDSQNSAQDEYSKYLDSYTARINKMKNSFIELSVALERSFLGDSLKIGISSIENTTKVFTDLIDTVGALPLTFGALGVAIAALHPPTRSLITNQTQLGLSTSKTGTTMVATANSAKGMTVAYTSASIAAQRLTAITTSLTAGVGVLGGVLAGIGRFLVGATLPIAGFMALGYAISKATEKFVDYRERQKEIKQQQDEINKSYSSSSHEIHKLADEYQLLSKKVDSGNLSDSSQEYLDVQNKLGELLPILVSHEDERGNKILRNVEAVKQELEYAKQLKDNYEQTEINNFENDLQKRADKVKNLQDEINNLQFYAQDGEDGFGDTTRLNAQREIIANERELQQVLQETNQFIKDKSNLYLSNSGALDNLNESSQQLIQTFVDENNNIKEAVQNGESYEDAVNKLLNKTTDFGERLAQLNTIVKNGSEDAWVGMIPILEEYGMTAQDVFAYVNQLTNSVEENTETVGLNEEALKELQEQYNNASSSISDLNGILDQLNEGQGISSDIIDTVINKYPELLSYIDDETAFRQKVIEKIHEQEDEQLKAITQMMMNSETYYSKLQTMSSDAYTTLATHYSDDLKNSATLAEAKLKIENKLRSAIRKIWRDHYGSMFDSYSDRDLEMLSMDPELQRKLSAERARQKAIYDALGELGDVTANFSTSFASGGSSSPSNKSGSGGSKSSSSKREIEKHTTDQYAQSIDNLNRKLAQSEGIQSTLTEGSKEWTDEIYKQNNYIREKQDLLHEQNNGLRNRNSKIEKELKNLGDYNNLSNDQKEIFNALTKELEQNEKQINSNSSSWWNLHQQIQSNIKAIEDFNKKQKELRESLADDIVQIYKDTYQKQREVAMKTIDDELSALEKAHNKKIDMLDEELSSYEEIINAKLKMLDRDQESEDFQTELEKLQKNRMSLQKQIDVLSLDDSINAQAKRLELEKELSEATLDIEAMKDKRVKDLRKQNLRDQLDDKRKETQNEKDALQYNVRIHDEASGKIIEIKNKTYEESKRLINEEREEWNRYYENLINDERRFNEIREDVLDGNLSGVRADFLSFKDFLEENSHIIGESLTNNLIDKITEFGDKLQEIDGMELDGINSQFLEIADILLKMKENSEAWWSAVTEGQKKALEQANDGLRKQLEDMGYDVDFNAGTGETTIDGQNPYDVNQGNGSSKNSSGGNSSGDSSSGGSGGSSNSNDWSDTNGTGGLHKDVGGHDYGVDESGNIYKNGKYVDSKDYKYIPDEVKDKARDIKKYHTGGQAGMTNFSFADKLKDSEIASILEKSEFVFQPRQLKDLLTKVTNPLINLPSLNKNTSSGGNTNHLTIQIDRITGDRDGGKTVIDTIVRGIEDMGGDI